MREKDLLFRWPRKAYYCGVKARDPVRLYYVYIVASRTRVLYIGVTGNIDRRMWEHKHGVREGFTKRYRVCRLVWCEAHADPAVAIAREKYLKGLTRAKKIAIIERENPTWEDLSAGWGEPRIASAQMK
jgi:putative endonuclease